MNTDEVIALALATPAALALTCYGWARWSLTRPAALEDPADDLMAVAHAVGVTTPTDVVGHVAHPALRPELTDTALTTMLAAWSKAAAPARTMVDPDHTICDNDDCDQVLCYCRSTDHPDTVCPGAQPNACTHFNALCGEHRPDCVDCRVDYFTDGPSW